jgi:hypothetical protein
MSLLPRLCLILVLTGLVSGCQVSAPVPASGDVTPNAVTGDAIEVTALDAAPAAAPAVGSGGSPTPPAQVATAPETEPPLPAADSAAEPAPAPVPAAEAGATAAAGETEAATEPAEVAPPPPPKSDLQIACERKRGSWEDTGGGRMICIRPTRDGGKRCTRESQCEGLCLARSGTCAPIDPLIGCQEIFQDDGSRVTQCIE